MEKSINIKFPLADNPKGDSFFATNSVTKSAIMSDLTLWLLCEKGYRMYDPDFGSNLVSQLFELNDSYTLNDIKEILQNDVKKVIPQLDITNVTGNVDDTTLNLNVYFAIRNGFSSEEGMVELKFG